MLRLTICSNIYSDSSASEARLDVPKRIFYRYHRATPALPAFLSPRSVGQNSIQALESVVIRIPTRPHSASTTPVETESPRTAHIDSSYLANLFDSKSDSHASNIETQEPEIVGTTRSSTSPKHLGIIEALLHKPSFAVSQHVHVRLRSRRSNDSSK